jgi:hypothetical protein
MYILTKVKIFLHNCLCHLRNKKNRPHIVRRTDYTFPIMSKGVEFGSVAL